MVRYGVPEKDINALMYWQHYNSFFHVLDFLARITSNLSCSEILASAFVRQHLSTGFQSLNSNVNETGIIILPKVKAIYDSIEPYNDGLRSEPTNSQTLKKWADSRESGVNQELSNLYYIEKESMGDYLITSHVMDDSVFLNHRESLTIGVSPVFCGDILEHKEYTRNNGSNTQRLFSITGLKNEKVINSRIIATIIQAAKLQIDILVFPEMLGNEENLSDKFFDAARKEIHDMGLTLPSMIVMPSQWRNNKNELKVIDGAGRCILKQQKNEPYLLTSAQDGNLYCEDLLNEAKEYHLLHIPTIGRFAFTICRDYLQPELSHLLVQKLKTTFLVCPSYSPKKTQFRNASLEPINYGCYTIWANTCSAFYRDKHKPEYVGLFSGPQYGETPFTLLRPKCYFSCGDPNSYCLFLLRISTNHNPEISCGHYCHVS